MTTPSELRRGLAFVEIGIDEAFLRAELGKAQAQVGQFASRLNAASAKVDIAKIGGMDVGGYDLLFARTLGSIHFIKYAIQAASAATWAFRGEREKTFDILTNLPLVPEMESWIRGLTGQPSMTYGEQRDSIKGLQGDMAKGEAGGLKLVDVFDRLRSETKMIGLRDLALELAKIDEEAKKLTAEAWTNPSTDDALRATVLGQIELWREAQIAAAETKAAYEKAWKEISEGSDRDVKAYFDTVEEETEQWRKADEKFGEKRWKEIEEGAERDVAAYFQGVEEIQAFSEELDRLAESVQTPAESIRALQDNLLTRMGLDPSGELYRRLMGKALGEFAEEGLRDAVKRTSQVRGTYSGREAGLLGRGGGAADAIAENTRKIAISNEKIALAAEAGFRWSN